MTKRKTIFLIILAVIILAIFTPCALAFVIRERSIVGLPDYYKKAARRECGTIDILLPMSGCIQSVQMAARNKQFIVENGKCPGGYTALADTCGSGCVSTCPPVKPKIE